MMSNNLTGDNTGKLKEIISSLSPEHVSINKDGAVVIRDSVAVSRLRDLTSQDEDADGNTGCANVLAKCG
jgi:hypothetical protein